MPEPQTPEATPKASPRSRKLATAVIILVLLPLVLPLPFYGLELLWIAPVIHEKVLACASFDCPPAVDWDRLAWIVVLGPSILVALASLLLGTLGLFRTRWRPTSPQNVDWFKASVGCGVVWGALLGSVLWFGIAVLALAVTG